MTASKRNYGTAGIKDSAVLRKNRPCLIKYHLTGCLREVVGFFEKMATFDSGRFVFVRKMDTLQDNAVKNWKTKERYGLRQIRRALAQAEELGILTFDIKGRDGQKSGYVVADHDKIAFSWIKGRRCTLTVQHYNALRRPAKPKHQKRTKTVRVTSPVTSSSDCVTSSEACVTSRVTSSASPGDIRCDIIREEQQHTKSATYQALDGGSESSFEEASLSQPSLASKESLYEPASEKQNPSPLSLAKKTVDNTAPSAHGQEKKLTPTYGSMLSETNSAALEVERFAEIVDYTTRGRIELGRLKKYEHGKELAEACVEAVESLSDEPWPTSPDSAFARIMGCVMDLMNGQGLNVPTPWVACLGQLRRKSKSEAVTYSYRGEKDYFNTPVPPTLILTDFRSSIRAAMEQSPDNELAKKLDDGRDGIKSLFVQIAEDKGVPRSWGEAIPFLDAVLAQPFPEHYRTSLKALRATLVERSLQSFSSAYYGK